MKALWKRASSHLKEDSHGRNYSLLPYGGVKTVEVVRVVHEDLHLCERENVSPERAFPLRTSGPVRPLIALMGSLAADQANKCAQLSTDRNARLNWQRPSVILHCRYLFP
ncbi:hypothetical protein ROHU_017256 [Labeo rohita]|uniref:Uncharacterized protein n=1 Tax=Labeo rohita TaxID=84645 RepID=A0A498NHF9_LABRO|nr:hypothetical protein ROHU_017256 [Labeo rohita]